ncbi:glycosyltransferase family 4 protein [Cellulophaga sp. Hel_I_12]|uniref:glycosyltransferase family 4 protein n=1 Tax=Cellulophaga sp. Hel_I_12 TaxID=1249972 RepID=UPI00064707F8|nr:glycosyltransferase family 4 protein [Cellulophaga sp. Hel_I_12]
MKLLFLTDNFPPEVNAPATRTYEHCREWVKQGVEVTVITCVPNFPKGKVFDGYKNKIFQKEIIDGIKVIRVWTYITANEGFLKRILDYLSFMISSFIAGLFVKTDVIIATSPQFFTAISGRWLSFWKRKKWIMEVRDLWPESIKAVGAMKTNPAIRFFELLENRMYKSANKIIVVTDSFKEVLIKKNNIDSSKISIIKNGVNTSLFQPIQKDVHLIQDLGLHEKFIIGYIGTHGMAHGLDFILECAKDISDKDIHFLFLGEGAKKQELLTQKENLKLDNITMLASVTKEEVAKYISIIDIGLVNLKKSDTFKSVLPSKIFELCGMHKPILLGVEGEAKKLVDEYQVGLTFEPENKKDFLEKIKLSKKLKITSDNFNRLITDFDRIKLSKKMLEFVKQ